MPDAPKPVDELQQMAGPSRTWKLGRYRFGRYKAWQWECSDGMLGSGGRTPIGALLGQIRWKREYRSKSPGYWAEPR